MEIMITMEVLKFSRSNLTEADAAKLNAARSAGAVTIGMRSAATDALTTKLREAQFANPKEDRIVLFNRVIQAHPNLAQLMIEPLLDGGYVAEIENIEEVA
jgi:hypothetical protein